MKIYIYFFKSHNFIPSMDTSRSKENNLIMKYNIYTPEKNIYSTVTINADDYHMAGLEKTLHKYIFIKLVLLSAIHPVKVLF